MRKCTTFPGPVGGHAEPADLLVRPAEAGVELATAAVRGDHRGARVGVMS